MKIMGAAAGVVVLSMTGVFFFLSDDTGTVKSKPAGGGQQAIQEEDSAARGATARTAEAEPIMAQARDRLQDPPGAWAAFEAWAAEDLRAQFGQTILNKGTQVSLMELRQFLKERYPRNWEAKLRDLLHEAFPDLADQVLETFDKMDAYNEWLEMNKPNLARMQGEDIKEVLWQRRRDLFGEDATEVWASQFGTEYVRDMMDIMEESDEIPIEDKLEVFKSAIDDTELGAVRGLVADSRQIMLGPFLEMQSVQSELGQMSPRERAESLRYLRRSMGVDEQETERMEKLDAAREQEWRRGLQYMAERDEITEAYEGARLEQELRFLRERYFEDRAKMMEAEEASGFFRYNRRRVYGRN